MSAWSILTVLFVGVFGAVAFLRVVADALAGVDGAMASLEARERLALRRRREERATADAVATVHAEDRAAA